MAMSGIPGDERRRGLTRETPGADVAPDLVRRVFHAARPHARRVSDQTSVRTTEGMADVSLLDATRCRIVGWEVASEMKVQTVLRALEVTCLRRGAFHGGLSFSCDRAHFDAGREDQLSARPRAWQRSAGFPPSGNRESDDTARRRA